MSDVFSAGRDSSAGAAFAGRAAAPAASADAAAPAPGALSAAAPTASARGAGSPAAASSAPGPAGDEAGWAGEVPFAAPTNKTLSVEAAAVTGPGVHALIDAEQGLVFYGFALPQRGELLRCLLRHEQGFRHADCADLAAAFMNEPLQGVFVAPPAEEVRIRRAAGQLVVVLFPQNSSRLGWGEWLTLGVMVKYERGQIGYHQASGVLEIPDVEADHKNIQMLEDQLNEFAQDNDAEMLAAPVPPEISDHESKAWELEMSIHDFIAYLGDKLIDQGIQLRLHGAYKLAGSVRPVLRTRQQSQDWFGLQAEVNIDDQAVKLSQQDLERGFINANGQTILLTYEACQTLLEQLKRGRVHASQLYDLAELQEMSEGDIFELEGAEDARRDAGQRIRQLMMAGDDSHGYSPPAGLQGVLRPYQMQGCGKMLRVLLAGFGFCLADDMGLGKTIQLLAVLQSLEEIKAKRSALIVAPVSTLDNWNREINTFTPGLKAHIHAGSQRAESIKELPSHGIVLTSYATLRNDAEMLQSRDWDMLVIDESQHIKNARTHGYRAVKLIRAEHRVALSGTPIENDLIELWAVMDLLNPGLFGSRSEFQRRFAGPIMRQHDQAATGLLQQRIHPLMLRRRKNEVASDLPPREEITVTVSMSSRQQAAYQELAGGYRQRISGAIEKGDRSEVGRYMLEGLLRLRQAAIMPSLVDPELDGVPSSKLDEVKDYLSDILAEGNKVLVFSQFLQVLYTLKEETDKIGQPSCLLTGATPQVERDQLVQRFQQDPGMGVFFISLKAGGTGINLTAADYVFIIDPWWNPAVENQAIDRAHRIGREGAVFAYRFITADTVEQRIMELQKKKQHLADTVLSGGEGLLQALNDQEILELFV
ncbi:MAG: DEAD/DEAH box helicase [Spirochaetaceae bacterium]|nr:MAG: DEAD/DEAH box helicase [Spirochaetaceae bacterium]